MARNQSWRLTMAEIRRNNPDWTEPMVQDYFARWQDAEGTQEDLTEHEEDFNNPHQVRHAQLPDIGPNDHHPQLHTLTSHTDVDVTLPKDGQGLWWDETQQLWVNRAAYEESWPTGLANGGELNIGPGVNDIEVLTGLGVITDSYTDPISPPVVTGISWDQINEPITAAPAVAGSVVWFSIYNTGVPAPGSLAGAIPLFVGALRQYNLPPNPPLAREEIFLGVAVHNGVEWKEISNPKVINQAAETLREVATTVLPLTTIISGGGITEQPNFELNQAEGVVWENNRNWHVNKADPNREVLPAAAPINFQYVNRDFSYVQILGPTFDPDLWDNAGTVEAVPGPANTTTIQRLYLDPANNYWVLLGQTLYTNFLEAQANLQAYAPVVPFILQNSIFLGSAVMEKGKNDWDVDEAVFIPAGDNAGSPTAGTPITRFIDLADTPPSYTGNYPLVPVVNPLELALEFDKRTKFVGDYVQGVEYNIGDEVADGSNLSECLANGVTSQPFVSPIGENVELYQGTMGNAAPQIAKLINFGLRIPAGQQPAYIKGYRIWTVAGNKYSAYAVLDPLGTPAISTLISFTAETDGWVSVALPSPSIYSGAVAFDVIVQVAEPDPTPVTFDYTYDYRTPENFTAPNAGEMVHGRSQPDLIGINYIDDGGNDRTAILQGLTVGDTIQAGSTTWSVQANTDQGAYALVTVAPAVVSPAGTQVITFETKVATPITIGEDPGWWDAQAAPTNLLRGLLGVDISFLDVVPDGNAYGVDVIVQDAFIPDPTEWGLKIVGGLLSGSSAGGGEDTTLETFRNLLYNGNFGMNQRGGSGTTTASNSYTLDGTLVGADVDWSRVTEESTGYYALQAVLNNAASGSVNVSQCIELNFGGAQGQIKAGATVTISGLVKFENNNGNQSLDYFATYRDTTQNNTNQVDDIPLASAVEIVPNASITPGVWIPFSYTYTVSADPAATNTTYMPRFQCNGVGTTDGYAQLTRLQFEIGPGTEFEEIPLGVRYAWGFRYFWRWLSNGLTPVLFRGSGDQTCRATVPFPSRMRTAPSIEEKNDTTGGDLYQVVRLDGSLGTQLTADNIEGIGVSVNSFRLQFSDAQVIATAVYGVSWTGPGNWLYWVSAEL